MEERSPRTKIVIGHQMIDLDPKWVTSIKEKLDDQPRLIKATSASSSCSIHRVPKCFRRHDKDAYTPQIISIGPLHYSRRKDDLEALEEHKWSYLHAVLTRNGEDSLETYLMALKDFEEEARECYSERIELKSNTFVEMMLLDGCFIIELFCRSMQEWGDHYDDDPMLKLAWIRSKLMIDLLMLENQIPFFILQLLFRLMNISGNSLIERALAFFSFLLPRNKKFDRTKIPVQHLLHLLHSSLLPPHTESENLNWVKLEMIHCASELHQAGIKFTKGNADSFMEIKFRHGVIEIPPLRVEDNTNHLFLNLVAFEQCYHHCYCSFMAYSAFMDCLINTEKDVEILCRKGIIDNWLGSNGDVATLFNKMGREVSLSKHNFYLLDVSNGISQYCGNLWPRWRASLMRNYFNNPWTSISVFAASLIIILTLAQTFLTAFPKFTYKG